MVIWARTRLTLALLCAVIAAACGAGDTDTGDRSASPPESAEQPGRCEPVEAAAEPKGPSEQATILREAEGDGPRVEAVAYPRPEYSGRPWSQWGQGLALADGRFLSAMGDHLGADGNSFLFVYDPATRRITRFADVLAQVEHTRGAWGYGKIHGQIVQGPCGDAYVATYWGSRRGLRFGSSYRGDHLFRLDSSTLQLEELGNPVRDHGIPSLAGFSPDGLVYGEAVDPTFEDEEKGDRGAFFVFDTTEEEIVFETNDDRHTGFRNILVDDAGTAYLAAEDGRLLAYEPGATALREVPGRLPGGGMLRASTTPAPDGTVYGVTQDPDRFFAISPDAEIADLGAAPGYTASLALDPDGERFFFVSGAHGDAWENGAPVVAVDTETGKQTTVVELNELVERELDLTLGGTYNVAVDPSGKRLYLGFNAGADREDPWGEVVLVIVHL